jgi:purine nucleoside phosphorylase
MTYENAAEAAEFIRSKYPHAISTAVVLGSGLGAFADELENAVSIPLKRSRTLQRQQSRDIQDA